MSVRIIGYSYEADFHCVRCAQVRIFDVLASPKGCDENEIPLAAQDGEGNPVTPVFSTDDAGEYACCGDCGAELE